MRTAGPKLYRPFGVRGFGSWGCLNLGIWWFSWTKKHLSSTHPFQKCSFFCSRCHFCWKPITIFSQTHTTPSLSQFHFLVTRDLVTGTFPMCFCDQGAHHEALWFWSIWPSWRCLERLGKQAFHGKMWEILWKSLRNGCFQCPKLSKCFLLKRNSSRKSLYKYMGMDQCRKNMEKNMPFLGGEHRLASYLGYRVLTHPHLNTVKTRVYIYYT